MKQAFAFEDNTEFLLAPVPTTPVRELPMTIRVYRHNETARTRASQLLRVQKEKDIAVWRSTIRCERDNDAFGSRCELDLSNDAGW
jgi:hypothetical protein